MAPYRIGLRFILILSFLIILASTGFSADTLVQVPDSSTAPMNMTNFTEATFTVVNVKPPSISDTANCYVNLSQAGEGKNCMARDTNAQDIGFNVTFPTISSGFVQYAEINAIGNTTQGSDKCQLALWNWTNSKWMYVNRTTAACSATVKTLLSYEINGTQNITNFFQNGELGGRLQMLYYLNGTAIDHLGADNMNITIWYIPYAKLNVTLLDDGVYPLIVQKDSTFNVSANITCDWESTDGAGCGDVNATIFWNKTSNTNPDTELNGTAGQKPLYNFTTPVNFSCGTMASNSQCYASWLINATGYVGQDLWLNVTASSSNGANTTDNFTGPSFQVLIRQSGSLNVTLISPSSPLDVFQNQTFNVSANINCGGGSCGTVNGTVFYNLTTVYPGRELNGTIGQKPFYNSSSLVNYSCGGMSDGNTCYVSWLVNATGAINTNWSLNVTARSDGPTIIINSTQPAFEIDIVNWGALNVTLLNLIPSPLIINQNDVFNFSGNITCRGGGCGSVNGTIFYNLTAIYPNQELNASSAHKPFYNFSNGSLNPVNISCGDMKTGSNCYVSWLVNATGNAGINWLLNVTARSNYSRVVQNSTQPNYEVDISTLVVVTSLQFTVTLAGAPSGNISTEVFPGNSTEDIWFNATGLNSKYIEPCRAPGGGINCQSRFNTPIMIFKNTGNVAFNISITLNASLPTYVKLWGNFSNLTDMSTCSGWSLGVNDTVIATGTWYNFTRNICANNQTAVWLFANWTDAQNTKGAPLIDNATLNYSSTLP